MLSPETDSETTGPPRGAIALRPATDHGPGEAAVPGGGASLPRVDLSIVIVSHNTRELLRRCLRSALAVSSLRTECIVVDNASADGSPDLLAEEFPEVRLLRNERNVGFAAGCNRGLRESRGEFLLLLNPDAEPVGDAVPRLVRFLERNPAVGACGPRLVDASGRYEPSARRFPTPWDGLFYGTGLRRLRHRRHPGLALFPAECPDHPRRVPTVSGACLLLRRDALPSPAPLDEGFFLYFEETDLLRRLRRNGWEVWFVPDAVVAHVGGASLGFAPPSDLFGGNHPTHWIRSRRRYMRKHHGLLGLLASETADLASCAAIWLRHRWKSGGVARARAEAAAMALRLRFAR